MYCRAAVPMLLLLSSLPLSAQKEKRIYDWLIIYYMPYDNDLSSFKNPILNQFKNLDLKGNVCITFQVDQNNQEGIKRYSINPNMDSISINEESSADARVFEDYLIWCANNFKAKKYAIILLSHGGLLNEYGLDLYPNLQWLPIDKIANSIKMFNKAEKIRKIDLLFEQVCTRGTIENFFEFRDVSKYTLASQYLVPLPNYYYSNTIKEVDNGEINSGLDLANCIVENERDDMYYSYTLIDNSQWKDWILLWRKYVQSIPKSFELRKEDLLTISYSKDLYFDFKSFLKSIVFDSEQPVSGIDLLNFTFKKLLVKHYLNPKSDKMIGYSGISIVSPFNNQYHELAWHKEGWQSNLQSLLNRLKE